MGELTNRLTGNAQSDMYPFHMPGHKRVSLSSQLPYNLDITEIEGFDDLNHPTEVLFDLNRGWAQMYGADCAWLLVNGSTSGVLAAISSQVPLGGHILMARNSHKSAYNCAYIRNLKVGYLYPGLHPNSGISLSIEPEDVDKYLTENPECRTVFITSPTYEGVVSDVRAIAGICHGHNAVLIVDAAHGAHLGFCGSFPDNPLSCGADIMVMSLHKTLPALTQSAIICIKGDRVDAEHIKKYVSIYNTSSPSYVLLAGMEQCYDMLKSSGQAVHEQYADRLMGFRKSLKALKKLWLFEPDVLYDWGKIVICTDRTTMSGLKLSEILRSRYHIETEMASLNYVVAMTSCMDSEQGFMRLYEALTEIDGQAETKTSAEIKPAPHALAVIGITQAYDGKSSMPGLSESAGRIAADYVYVYPPGIPWLVPGERITDAIAAQIEEYMAAGFGIQGISPDKKIKVVEN